MKKTFQLLTVGLLTAAVLAAPTFAKGRGGGGRKGGGGGGGGQKSGGESPAQKEVDTDNTEVQKDQAALNAITDHLHMKMQSSPDYVAAVAALKNAQADYDAEYSKVISSLQGDPKYVAAVKTRNDAQKASDKLHSDTTSTPADIATAAQTSLAAGKVVSDMQSDALEADPKIASMKAAMNDDTARIATIKTNFDATMATDKDWSAAKATLDAAQAKLDDARKKLPNA